jgi:RNA polymerase sigma factor (sigma-70 family)
VLDRYGRLIWSIAIRLGARQDEAEEIFQRTWVAVVGGIHDLERADRLTSWIASTARYQTFQLFDEGRRRRRGVSLDDVASSEMARDDCTEDTLQRCDEAALLHQALDRLDPRCQGLLRLLFFEDPAPDYQEISHQTGLAVGSIGPIRARCLKRLRKHYAAVYQRAETDDP